MRKEELLLWFAVATVQGDAAKTKEPKDVMAHALKLTKEYQRINDKEEKETNTNTDTQGCL